MADYSELIVAIYKHGCYRQEGRRAIDALVNGGELALDAILIARNEPPASDLHPRDLSDTISAVFAGFANREPDLLIEKYESDEINEFEIFWALGSAKGERSVDTLIAGLKSKNKYSRWAAVESLVRQKSNKVAPALIEALKDRSSIVPNAVNDFRVATFARRW